MYQIIFIRLKLIQIWEKIVSIKEKEYNLIKDLKLKLGNKLEIIDKIRIRMIKFIVLQ